MQNNLLVLHMSTIAITEAKNNHIVPAWLIIFLVLVGEWTVYMRGVAFRNQRNYIIV